MDEAARAALARLLAEEAFTRAELLAALRRDVPGLEGPRGGELIDELLAGGSVRKLPPRPGSSYHLLGTPHPRSYLGPLFAAMAKSLGRLLVQLESEGVPRDRVLQEARAQWEEALRLAQEEQEEPAETGQEQPAATTQAPPHGQSAGLPSHRTVLQTLERLAPPGSEVPVRRLRREVGTGVSREDFDRALLQLTREGRFELRPMTPPQGGAQPPAEDVVTGPDGRPCDRVVRRG
jgi:hypothetical protein